MGMQSHLSRRRKLSRLMHACYAAQNQPHSPEDKKRDSSPTITVTVNKRVREIPVHERNDVDQAKSKMGSHLNESALCRAKKRQDRVAAAMQRIPNVWQDKLANFLSH